MGKSNSPLGMYRESVHDGSSVTHSVLRVNPRPGLGKHAKTEKQIRRRHAFYHHAYMARKLGQPEVIPVILSVYRNTI